MNLLIILFLLVLNCDDSLSQQNLITRLNYNNIIYTNFEFDSELGILIIYYKTTDYYIITSQVNKYKKVYKSKNNKIITITFEEVYTPQEQKPSKIIFLNDTLILSTEFFDFNRSISINTPEEPISTNENKEIFSVDFNKQENQIYIIYKTYPYSSYFNKITNWTKETYGCCKDRIILIRSETGTLVKGETTPATRSWRKIK